MRRDQDAASLSGAHAVHALLHALDDSMLTQDDLHWLVPVPVKLLHLTVLALPCTDVRDVKGIAIVRLLPAVTLLGDGNFNSVEISPTGTLLLFSHHLLRVFDVFDLELVIIIVGPYSCSGDEEDNREGGG